MSAAAEGRAATLGGAPARQRALRAQGRRTMQKLLDAGIKVFDERGYQAARVDDVVKAAKTSHGTFYLYFANKEDLFRVLAEDCAAAMRELASRLGEVGPGHDGYQELRGWLAGFVATYRQYGPVIRTWSEAQPADAEVLQLGIDAMDRLLSALTARIAEQDPNADPGQSAIALLAMVERLNYYLLSRKLPVGDDDLLDTLTSILHVGVFGGRRNGPAKRAALR